MKIEVLMTSKYAIQTEKKNFEITEILKRRNYEADTERGHPNRGISVHAYIHYCIFQPFSQNY